MQKIVPHLWFDKEAVPAAEFYASTFPDSKVTFKSKMGNTPSGDVDIVAFSIMGFDFQAISAGPMFKINPSISFTISCKTAEEVDELWKKLIEGGESLMELGEYPFSKRYGWLKDKYGVSWQLIVSAAGVPTQRVTPGLMFTGNVTGRAEEAMKLYTSLFEDSKINNIFPYKNQPPDKDGTVAHALFTLAGEQFIAMDSAREHKFGFNEAVSLIVKCKDQAELDSYWSKLSAVPASEQCGWLKDKYGVSWQIQPENMGELIKTEKAAQAMLKMKKLDIAELKKSGIE